MGDLSSYRQIPNLTGQNLTIGATSVQSAAFSAETFSIRITSVTGNCHVAVGPNPTALATDMLVKNTDPSQVLSVVPGEKIAVIQDGSSTGTLNIVELTG